MMNKGFSWILVVFWLVTLAMLAMDKGMMGHVHDGNWNVS